MRSRTAFILAAALLAGCSLAPRYAVPHTVPAPPSFKEGGPWTAAAPADDAPRGPWWRDFGDPVLSGLEERIETSSPGLAEAVARYDQARALVRGARADLLPQVDATAGAERGRQIAPNGVHVQQHDVALLGQVSYEVDLWGRVRSEVSARQAEAQASAADLSAVRLSLQAELAETYFRLRGADELLQVLRKTIAAYKGALDLTATRYREGASSEVDVARARDQLATAQSQFEQTAADRAVFEHAIAAVLGEQASTFSLPSTPAAPVPVLPVTAPSTLLQHRPDVATAERRVAAANARIGSARAAMFPSLVLGGSGGFEETVGPLLANGATVWALGPAVAALSVFDGGRRRSEVARARGEFAEAAAAYRQSVLDAFREAEDGLVLYNRLAVAAGRQDEAVAAAHRADALANTLYREGATDFLAVVVAQTAELDARRTAASLRTRRLVAGVDLVRAFGGGWTASAASGTWDPTSRE